MVESTRQYVRRTYSLAIVLLGLLVLAGLGVSVLAGALDSVDVAILRLVRDYHAPVLTALATVLAWVGGGSFLYVQLAIATLALWRVRLLPVAMFLAISLGGGTIVSEALKVVFQRARPDVFEPLLSSSGFAFPSGHAMTALCFYGTLVLLAWTHLPPGGRRAVIGTALVVLILMVGLSRVYLGVHYASDVLAGWAAGLVWLAGCALAFSVLPSGSRAG